MPKRCCYETIRRYFRFCCCPNLLRGGVFLCRLSRVEVVWVAGIIYLNAGKEPVFLNLVADAGSRCVAGYYVWEILQTQGVANALKMGIGYRKAEVSLICRSVRGVPYCSVVCLCVHDEDQICCSMADGYDGY